MRALLLSLILLLAGAVLPAHAQRVLPGLTEGIEYRYIEGGKPYRPLPPGMVEVAEVFAYWCPHCAHFAPMLDTWKQTLPANARLVYVPAVFDRDDPYARAYFAAEAARAVPVLHPRLFLAIHQTGQLPRNASVPQVLAFASRVQGVDAAAFKAALENDKALLPQLEHAYNFERDSGVEGTPTLIVAGRYRVIGNSYEGLLVNAGKIVAALSPKKPAPARKPAPAAKPKPRA